MRHIRIIHRFRICVAVAGFLAVATLVGLVAWANQTGLPDAWRQGISEALAKHGVHAEIASLRFVPFRGFVAGEVVLFSDPSHQRVAGRLQQLIFDLDRSQLTRGEFQIERLQLSGARFMLAADPLDPQSETLDISDLTGQIEFAGPHSLVISEASGRIHGIRLDLHCLLDLYRTPGITDPVEEELARDQRRQVLIQVIQTLESFEFPASLPPRIRLEIRGDLEDPESLRASIQVRASNLLAREVNLREVDLRGELYGSTLVLHHGNIRADRGELTGNAEYDLWKARGHCNLRSTLDIPALLRQLQIPLPEDLPSFSAPPVLEARAEFSRNDDGNWDKRVIGQLQLAGPRWRDIAVDQVSTSFAWDGSQLLLEDLDVQAEGGELTGRIFIQPEMIRYDAASTLPLHLWQQGIPIEPLRTILNDFSAGEGFDSQVVFHGHAHPHHDHDWSFIGDASAHHLLYQGVPAREGRVKLDLSGEKLDFREGHVVFDYEKYPLKLRHGGAASGTADMDLIRYDDAQQVVIIENLKGTAWPAPILRTFAPEVADELEVYGFHQPPDLAANGVIGILEGLPKQNLTVNFSSKSPMDYTFLDENLVLERPEGVVRVLPDRVRVEDLAFDTLGGAIRASVNSLQGKKPRLSGSLDWTELDLKKIANAYHLKSPLPGRITGRADFSLKGDQVSGLDAQGHLAIEDSQLFDVPILGPLSPVVATVLGNRKAGFQEASSAFFTFNVEEGVLHSHDFLTTTPSLVFTADGSADLNDQTLDMTVRMNARGLLGVITLPLKPFYGLFQFRGTGPLQNPEWDNVMFTSPPDEEQNQRLMEPPRALPVLEGAPRPHRETLSPRKKR